MPPRSRPGHAAGAAPVGVGGAGRGVGALDVEECKGPVELDGVALRENGVRSSLVRPLFHTKLYWH